MRLTIPLLSLAAVLALLLVFSRAVEEFTHRDEHQFVVPGLLTVEKGLVPYRDYPLFHMPYLILLHGVLGAATKWPLLSARIVTAGAAWLTLVLLGFYAWHRAEPSPRWRLPLALAVPTMLLVQPIFADTIAYVWNHAVPVLFVVLACILHCHAAERADGKRLLLCSGASVALAACMRLTFLPLVAPFGLAIFFFPQRTWRARIELAAWFGLAAFIVFVPALWLFARAPEQFLFGNLSYPKLSVAWRNYPIWREDLSRFVDPVRGFLDPLHEGFSGRGLDRKLRKAVSRTLTENWPILCAFAVNALGALVVVTRTRARTFHILFLGMLLPFVFWGCVAPSRFHVQYFYALMPLLLIGCVELWRLAQSSPRLSNLLGATFAFLTVVSVAVGWRHYIFVRQIGSFEKWGPVIAHRMAQRVRAEASPGRMLTFDPLIVVEAGIPIYPELSSGDFGWRTAHLLPLEKRQRLHMVCAFDIDAWLARDPPGNLFLDWNEQQLTPPITNWAKNHGYRPGARHGKYELWYPPAGDPRN
jgi:hypothetical protein